MRHPAFGTVWKITRRRSIAAPHGLSPLRGRRIQEPDPHADLGNRSEFLQNPCGKAVLAKGKVAAKRTVLELTDPKALDRTTDVVIWLGHSSFLIRLGGKTVLVDPVFNDHGAPFSFLNKAFPGTDLYTADDMPQIDYLLISHDHWDHLDYQTVTALRPKVKAVICPLGVGADFEYWGYPGATGHRSNGAWPAQAFRRAARTFCPPPREERSAFFAKAGGPRPGPVAFAKIQRAPVIGRGRISCRSLRLARKTPFPRLRGSHSPDGRRLDKKHNPFPGPEALPLGYAASARQFFFPSVI